MTTPRACYCARGPTAGSNIVIWPPDYPPAVPVSLDGGVLWTETGGWDILNNIENINYAEGGIVQLFVTDMATVFRRNWRPSWWDFQTSGLVSLTVSGTSSTPGITLDLDFDPYAVNIPFDYPLLNNTPAPVPQPDFTVTHNGRPGPPALDWGTMARPTISAGVLSGHYPLVWAPEIDPTTVYGAYLHVLVGFTGKLSPYWLFDPRDGGKYACLSDLSMPVTLAYSLTESYAELPPGYTNFEGATDPTGSMTFNSLFTPTLDHSMACIIGPTGDAWGSLNMQALGIDVTDFDIDVGATNLLLVQEYEVA